MQKKKQFIRRQILFLAASLSAFIGLTYFLFTFKNEEKRFIGITSRIFREEMQASTLNMHYTIAHPENFGIYYYEPTLPILSNEDCQKSRKSISDLLNSLYSIRTDHLSEADAWLHRLLTRYLENSLALSNYFYYQNPLSPAQGMQSQLPILLAEYTFRTRQDVEDYLILLSQTGTYYDSLLAYEENKNSLGISTPASSLRQTREQCNTIVTLAQLEKNKHFLQTTFTERLQPLLDSGCITSEEASVFTAKNHRLLREILLPAYQRLGNGIEKLEDDSCFLSGLSSHPEGQAYYRYLLIAETGSYRTIEEIKSLLATQFSAEYQTINEINQAHPEALVRYRSIDEIHFPDMEVVEILADLQKRMEGTFPDILGEKVNTTVKSVASSLEAYCAPAFYLTSPLDDDVDNVIYINQSRNPDPLELYTTLAHEGFPGHLYQNVYCNRHSRILEERPVRKLLCYGGFQEGWALYTEFLSYDYATDLLRENHLPEDAVLVQLEKHNRSLQLCLYSFLDIMIHYDNATFQQVDALLRRFGITENDAILSIYTYITQEPCNYLKYYLGYLELLLLKGKAREIWEDNYSDYLFHRFLLDYGPADFRSLEELLITADQPVK